MSDAPRVYPASTPPAGTLLRVTRGATTLFDRCRFVSDAVGKRWVGDFSFATAQDGDEWEYHDPDDSYFAVEPAPDPPYLQMTVAGVQAEKRRMLHLMREAIKTFELSTGVDVIGVGMHLNAGDAKPTAEDLYVITMGLLGDRG